jgi:hypothetical protein
VIEQYVNALENFQAVSEEILELSKTAERNKKSLTGSNFYGDKFRSLQLSALNCKAAIGGLFDYVNSLQHTDKEQVLHLMEQITSPQISFVVRRNALHDFKVLAQTKLLPSLQNSQQSLPKTQQVLSLSVVADTRGYISKITIQMNGCYEHGWYDACSVMMRKLIEILIIECYESENISSQIKDTDGNFLMLSGLVDKILSSHWNLGRETKKALPEIKTLGDRSAHTRRCMSTKQDIDKILSGFRVAVDELLHLAKLK